MLRHLGYYEDGADLSLINVIYIRPKKEEDGTRTPDYLDVIYKDNVEGIKYHDMIMKPEYSFYMLKPEYKKPGYSLLFEDKNKLDKKTVRYYNLLKEISKLTDQEDVYNDNVTNGDFRANKELQRDTRLFNSDQPIEDHFRIEFSKRFTNKIIKMNKSYYDIETDIRYCNNDFPEMGECPVNAISFFDESHSDFYSFLLRNSKNPLIDDFERGYNENRYSQKYIDKFVHDNMGDSIYNEMSLGTIKYKIVFFTEEIDLIHTFFNTVINYNPDFIQGWNTSAFDLQYLIARVEVLGYDPRDIICNQEWDYKYLIHYVDERHINDLPNRGDYTCISGYTVWIDQMIQFASRRKNKFASFGSMKLDSIGEIVAHVRKLNYSNITNNIGDLPYLNFKIFVLYNIFDTLDLKCIEFKNKDIEYLYNKCTINCTSYNKAHRQTVYLVNRMTKEWDKLGYIIGNNNNRWNEKPEKYLGALVQDPLKTNDYAKQKINGKSVMIVDNDQDYDFKSLYPSTMLQWNIAPNTQIGKIIIDNKVYDDENPFMNEAYSRGGDYVESLVTQNIIEFAHRWLHLANVNEFLIDWNEYNQKNLVSYSNYTGYLDYKYYNHQLYTAPIKFIGKGELIPAIEFRAKGLYKPLLFFKDLKDSEVVLDNDR